MSEGFSLTADIFRSKEAAGKGPMTADARVRTRITIELELEDIGRRVEIGSVSWRREVCS